jgi:hypothetical protein
MKNAKIRGKPITNSKAYPFRRAPSLIGRLLWPLLFTFLLLEIATRLVWWGNSTIELNDKEITLLPVSLITEAHLQTLKEWSLTSDSYLVFDPILGWNIRPNAVVEKEGVTFSSNSMGIRSLREYSLVKPKNITRIAAFGPSFTFADEVPDEVTWPALMEQARPDLEVMNWGIGGYGTDQAFLRYQTQGTVYKPDIVLMGYEDNNRQRNVNYFRPFYKSETDLPLVKPVYTLAQDELVLVEIPFKDFDSFYDTLLNNPNHFLDLTCLHDYFCERQRYQPLALDRLASFRFLRTLIYTLELTSPPKVERPEPEEISLRILERFAEEVAAQGATPILVLFPQQVKLLSDFEKGKQNHSHKFIPAIQERGGQVIDLYAALVEAKQAQNLRYEDFFIHGAEGGHYTELGNRLVAEAILQYLSTLEK